jgi:probable phosphomutase (TIGR03848 family)
MLQTLAIAHSKISKLETRHKKNDDNLGVMARIILLRHAHSIANEEGILSGQLPGVSLSTKGREQAVGLIERIGPSEFDSIRVSPMQRCQETIAPWLESSFASGLKRYVIDEQIIEMNYGKWSGRKLRSLSREKLWKDIQSKPSKVKFPDGESFTVMQKRATQSVLDAVKEKKNGTHLLISHGDVIKAITAHFLKMKLDDFQSLVANPASLTIFEFDGTSARLVAFNDSSSIIAAKSTRSLSKKLLLGGGSGTDSPRKK